MKGCDYGGGEQNCVIMKAAMRGTMKILMRQKVLQTKHLLSIHKFRQGISSCEASADACFVCLGCPDAAACSGFDVGACSVVVACSGFVAVAFVAEDLACFAGSGFADSVACLVGPSVVAAGALLGLVCHRFLFLAFLAGPPHQSHRYHHRGHRHPRPLRHRHHRHLRVHLLLPHPNHHHLHRHHPPLAQEPFSELVEEALLGQLDWAQHLVLDLGWVLLEQRQQVWLLVAVALAAVVVQLVVVEASVEQVVWLMAWQLVQLRPPPLPLLPHPPHHLTPHPPSRHRQLRCRIAQQREQFHCL